MRSTLLLLLLALAVPVYGQSSPSYQVSDQVLNAGGSPSAGLAPRSAGFRVEISSIGAAVISGTATSPGYSAEAGYVAAYRPVGEIVGLVFSDRDTLAWSGHPGALTYTLWRDRLPLNSSTVGDCVSDGISALEASDLDLPAAGAGFVYLVSGRSRLAQEGSLGSAHDGTTRTPATPCP